LPCAQRSGLATDSWTIVDIKADRKTIFPFQVSEKLSVKLAVISGRTRSDEANGRSQEKLFTAPDRLIKY
jgi:hypothetical protein